MGDEGFVRRDKIRVESLGSLSVPRLQGTAALQIRDGHQSSGHDLEAFHPSFQSSNLPGDSLATPSGLARGMAEKPGVSLEALVESHQGVIADSAPSSESFFAMDLQKAKQSADSSEGEHGSTLEKLGGQGKNKSLLQLASEVEDLFGEQRPGYNQKSAGIRTRYVE